MLKKNDYMVGRGDCMIPLTNQGCQNQRQSRMVVTGGGEGNVPVYGMELQFCHMKKRYGGGQ